LEALREARRVAVQRLAVLEWPYEEQSYGPPLEHRMAYERIVVLAQLADLKLVTQVRLESLVLYIFGC
jgi:hypothetical protein